MVQKGDTQAKKTLTRKEQAEQTRAALREAGVQLIQERRYDDIKIEDITRMCGVSKGTFYLYFNSKDDFFFAMCAHDFGEAVAQLEDEKAGPALGQIRQFIATWIRLQKETSLHFARHWFVTLLEGEKDPASGKHIDPGKQYRKPLKDCLNRAIANGELTADTPVDDVVELIIMSVYGSSLRDVMSGRKTKLTSWSKKLSSFIVDGCLGPYTTKQ